MFSSLLLLFGAIFLVPTPLPVHGQFTGTVCIIPNGSANCPASTPTITGTPGTQLRVSIFLQGSDGTNGFSVILLADHTILKPAGVDITGTVIPGPQTIVVECIGGVLIQGPTCNPADSLDTIELALVACGGCPNTSAPTTGLLFTAIYNVTASTAQTPIGYQSSTNCNPSSVSGTNTCIQIANGTGTPDPENALTANFTTMTDFTISASPTALTVAKNSQGTSTITLASIGFSGTVTLSLNVSPTSHAPSTSLSPTSVALSSGGTGSSTLTVGASKHTGLGSYTVTVTGTSGSISHSVSVAVTVTR